LFLVWMIVSKD